MLHPFVRLCGCSYRCSRLALQNHTLYGVHRVPVIACVLQPVLHRVLRVVPRGIRACHLHVAVRHCGRQAAPAAPLVACPFHVGVDLLQLRAVPYTLLVELRGGKVSTRDLVCHFVHVPVIVNVHHRAPVRLDRLLRNILCREPFHRSGRHIRQAPCRSFSFFPLILMFRILVVFHVLVPVPHRVLRVRGRLIMPCHFHVPRRHLPVRREPGPAAPLIALLLHVVRDLADVRAIPHRALHLEAIVRKQLSRHLVRDAVRLPVIVHLQHQAPVRLDRSALHGLFPCYVLHLRVVLNRSMHHDTRRSRQVSSVTSVGLMQRVPVADCILPIILHCILRVITYLPLRIESNILIKCK